MLFHKKNFDIVSKDKKISNCRKQAIVYVGIEPKFNAESGNYLFANIFYGYVAYFAYLVQGLFL